jgi:hypothetical protein
MSKKYILLNNFIDDKVVDFILTRSKTYKDLYSKVGVTVQKDKKIRKDVFFNEKDVVAFDQIIFSKSKEMMKHIFNYDIEYRESYKLGRYHGSEGGFYNPHSDTQGGMRYRKLSAIVCLSDKKDYQGGLFRFLDLDREFRFTKGDAIFFDSSLLHGVEPVTGGLREVLICFFFDKSGFQQKLVDQHSEIVNNQTEVVKIYNRYISRYTEQNVKHNDFVRCNECNSWRYSPLVSQTVKNVNNENKKIMNKNPQANQKTFLQKHMGVAGTRNLIYPILPDSGPGNQIVGLKETLIISLLLDKICVIPFIRAHYLETKSNQLSFYNFKELYNLKLKNIIIDDEIKMNITDVQNIYCLNGNYHKKVLHNERILEKNPNCQELLLKNTRFDKKSDIDIFRNSEESLLVLKHVFNNVCISPCRNNGCSSCDLNQEFYETYRLICKAFDFSDMIKKMGNTYIKNNLGKDYIAVHMRYPDIINGKTLEEHTKELYSEENIHQELQKMGKKIFIATNKPNILNDTLLQEFNQYSGNDKTKKYDSWVQQYICSQSSIFYESPFNDYRNVEKNHQRSTWSSFVRDYRTFLMDLPSDKTTLLTELLF